MSILPARAHARAHAHRVRTQEVNNSLGRGLWSGGAESWTICRGVGGNAKLQLSRLLLMSAATNCDGSSGFSLNFCSCSQHKHEETLGQMRFVCLFFLFTSKHPLWFLASSCGTVWKRLSSSASKLLLQN